MAKTIEQLLSLDFGRTATKACISRNHDDVAVIPANVKQLAVEEVRQGFDEEYTDPLLDLWLEYQSQGYAIGQLAADFGADLGLGQRKIEDALIKTFACIGYFGLGNQKLGIVLGLPFLSQQQFDREKSETVRLLQGSHTMYYRGDVMNVEIQQVWVVPEGYGSLILCETQSKGQKSGKSFADAAVAVVDIGYQTTDFLLFDRFRFSRGASSTEEFAMAQFYERLAERIPGADSQSLSLIEAVNQPEGKRFYRAQGMTQMTDLDMILPEIRSNFARELYTRLIHWLPERARDIIVTGGGGEFFWGNLETLIKASNLAPHIAVPSRQANALGQYIYGEARLKEYEKERRKGRSEEAKD